MDDRTIITYNNLAEEYDSETADFWERFPRTFFDKFISIVPKGKKVLDIGSGPGRDGLILKNLGMNVICLDASEKMIELCMNRGLEAVVGDFLELPFEDGSFDAVWAYTSLLHIKKEQINSACKQIYRVLKPEGILGLGMIEGDTELYRESSGVNQPRWFAFYKKEELESLLINSGFKIEHFECFSPKTKNYLNIIARKK